MSALRNPRREKPVCIYGAGGFGRETLLCLMAEDPTSMKEACFMVDDEYFHHKEILGARVIPLSKFAFSEYEVVVAIGDPQLRKAAIKKLPGSTTFATVVHPTAIISDWVQIGEGSIVMAGTVVTCNISIGKHAHLNLHTTIGHDCQIGDFITTGPAVNISGNCKIEECVYLGTNCSLRENITITGNTTVGMGSVVVKDIYDPGTYIGNPAKKLY